MIITGSYIHPLTARPQTGCCPAVRSCCSRGCPLPPRHPRPECGQWRQHLPHGENHLRHRCWSHSPLVVADRKMKRSLKKSYPHYIHQDPETGLYFYHIEPLRLRMLKPFIGQISSNGKKY
jgi:hypothetical protein